MENLNISKRKLFDEEQFWKRWEELNGMNGVRPRSVGEISSFADNKCEVLAIRLDDCDSQYWTQ